MCVAGALARACCGHNVRTRRGEGVSSVWRCVRVHAAERGSDVSCFVFI